MTVLMLVGGQSHQNAALQTARKNSQKIRIAGALLQLRIQT
jgi:hypothetical protein